MKCHICGKFGSYTEMIDYTAYSVHPKCEHKEHIISKNIKEFRDCSICIKKVLSRDALRRHLIRDHTIEGPADLIVNSIHKV
jgi:hypothetical protein